MHFYRPLRELRALTFDLDDTLYDNRPVIARTEYESVQFLQQYHPAPRSILHVGDDLEADVTGAIRYGMQACWINDRGGNFAAADARLLPHLEISRLASLTALL